MKKIDNINIILEFLERKDEEGRFARKKADINRIHDDVRRFINMIGDSLYIEFNDGRASGLCEEGFYQSDLDKCILNLRKKANK